MFSAPGEPRAHYRPLYGRLDTMSPDDFGLRQQTADLSSCVRVSRSTFIAATKAPSGSSLRSGAAHFSRRKWVKIEAGLKQRLTALNMFIHDIYHEQRILRQGMCLWDWCSVQPGYRPEFRDCEVAHDIYIHVAGIDLVRDADGEVLVLEDNLRCPSGVSYVLENRSVMKHVMPHFSKGTGCAR